MSYSRRELAVLLPAMAATAVAQQPNTKTGSSEPPQVLPAKTYPFEELAVRTSANGAMKSRAVFDGATTRGQRITAHITELAPGQAPHAPARQKHDEVIMLCQGTLEVTLNGENRP